MKSFATGLALLCLFVFSGCQMKAEYWVNPDGSGKAVIDYVCQTRFLPEETGVEAEKFMGMTVGVSQWADVKVVDMGDRYSFHGVAYFDNVDRFNLRTPSGFIPVFKRENGMIAGVEFEVPQAREFNPTTAPAAVTDEAQALETARTRGAELLEKERKNNENGVHSFTTRTMRMGKVEYIIHLPGTVTKATNLKHAGNKVEFICDGEKSYQTMLAMWGDSDVMKKSIMAGEKTGDLGRAGPLFKGEFNRRMWGENAPVKAAAGEGKELFDYKKELAGLTQSKPQMLENSGMVQMREATAGYEVAWAAPQITAGDSGPGWKKLRLAMQGNVDKGYFLPAGGVLTRVTDREGKPVMPGGASRVISTYAGEPGAKRDKGLLTVPVSQKVGMTCELSGVEGEFGVIEGFVRLIVGDGIEESDLGVMKLEPCAQTGGIGFGFDGVGGVSRTKDGVSVLDNASFMFTAAKGVIAARVLIKGQGEGGGELDVWPVWPWRDQGTWWCSHMSGTSLTGPVHVKVWTIKNPRVVIVPIKLKNVKVELEKK